MGTLTKKYTKMLSAPSFPSAKAEVDFWERRGNDQFATRRWLLLLGALLLWSFGIMDWFVGGEAFTVLFAIRSAGSIAALFCTYWFCKAKTQQARERFVLWFGYAAIVSEVLMAAAAPSDAVGYYLFGLAVVLSFGAVLIAPNANTTTSLFCILVGSYSVALPFFDMDLQSLTICSVFLLLIAAAATIGSFERERLERLRAISEAELALANAELVGSRKEALEARDKEIEANQAKNRFIAGVSHELRTPLNAIIGFSDVMRNEMFGVVQPVQYQEYVDLIFSSGQILEANISDLMDMARIDSGKMGWIDADFLLSDVMDQAMATCQASADDAGVSLAIDASATDIQVHADATRITQAIINLTVNAVKFTSGGGQVSLSAAHRENGSVALSVSDTGRGMSAEDLKRIREPFAQAHHDSAGGKKGGLGLGLAIVSGILDQIGGQLEIDSEVDVGTRATLVIPAERVVAQQKKAA